MEPAPPLPKRQRLLVRLTLSLIGLVLIGTALVAVALYEPNEYSLWPKCMLHTLTGLHCPGCGLTRSTHALLNGHVMQAFAYNALWPVAYVLLVVFGGRAVWPWLRGRTEPTYPPGWWARWWSIVFAVCLMSFFVLRNIPLSPFTFLAPHKLRE